MTDKRLKHIAIIGGGSAGWMCAAAVIKALGREDGGVKITLVESESIGTVGVGEATIPPIKLFNRDLGISEHEFVRLTSGSYKLGIEFVDWAAKGTRYFHPFGEFGADFDAVPMYQHYLAARRDGLETPLDDFSMAWAAAKRGKFHPPSTDKRQIQSTFDYAYHFDTGLYAKFLRDYSEARGVTRIEGKVVDVNLHSESGHITAVTLEDGQSLAADFFVDCTGFRGLLIGGALGVGYENWSRWLPCDRAVTVGTQADGAPIPYTRATARDAGWQWRIPLQHRTGNGYVYCSEYLSPDQAEQTLVDNLDGTMMGSSRHLRFTTGRRDQFWHKNCVAIGLSAGFMEPLESTSLHLIQTAIRRLLALLPDSDHDPLLAGEFNRITGDEYATIRDFLILHYKATTRDDAPLWRYVRDMAIPENLSRKMAHFARDGRLVSNGTELFANPSWLAVYIGQGIIPAKPEPRLAQNPHPKSREHLAHIRDIMVEVAQTMPSHGEYIERFCKASTA